MQRWCFTFLAVLLVVSCGDDASPIDAAAPGADAVGPGGDASGLDAPQADASQADAPQADASNLTPDVVCADLCTAALSCGVTDWATCYNPCWTDLFDCTPTEMSALDACADVSCADMGACRGAQSCVDTG